MYVTAANLNPFNSCLVKRRGAGGGDILSDTLGYLEKGAKVGGKIGLTFAGFLLLVVGALGKTLAPNGTAWDIGSMFAMIGGAIMSIIGFFQFWKTDKKITPDDLPDAHHEVDSELELELRTCAQNISNIDPYFENQDFTRSPILRSSSNPTLRNHALALLEKRFKSQFMYTLASYKGGADLVVDNANGPDKPLTINEIKDSNAALVAYIIAGEPSGAVPPGDYSNLLKSTFLDKSNPANIFPLLPGEFKTVYDGAKHWKEKNIDPTDEATRNVNKVVTFPVSGEGTGNLKYNLSQLSGSTEREAGKKHLSGFEIEYNYGKTLEQAITYVLTVEGQDPAGVDAKRLRNAAVLRCALIAGFDIKASGLASVHRELRKILGKDDSGLKGQIKKLGKHFTDIDTMIRSHPKEVEMTHEPMEIEYKEIGSGLIRFKEVTPSPGVI